MIVGEAARDTVSTADSVVEVEIHGSGDPTTVVGHGLAAGISETRPLASGIRGTTAFLSFRGHGRTVAWGPDWDYPALGRELRAVADATQASRAFGVSMGAGAILSTLAETPDRFESVLILLPGAIDSPRTDSVVAQLERTAALVDSGDVHGLEAALLEDLPPEVRSAPGVPRHVAARARALAGTSVSRLLRGLPAVQPVPDRALLAKVTARCLVVGHEGDRVHPAQVARDLAEALGPDGCECRILPDPAALWLRRQELRSVVAGFFRT